MTVQEIIRSKLQSALSPAFLDVVNESHMHAVPENAETHFNVTLVADAFEGQRRVQRHQQVYRVLAEELSGGVHALALHTYTPSEWQGSSPASPRCLGGSKSS